MNLGYERKSSQAPEVPIAWSRIIKLIFGTLLVLSGMAGFSLTVLVVSQHAPRIEYYILGILISIVLVFGGYALAGKRSQK